MPRKKSPSTHRNPGIPLGFTLIELLVVISISAIILGLALPALSGTRESAIILRCMSNARQVGLVMDEYAVGSDGLYPFAGFNTHQVTLPDGGEGGPVGGRLGVARGMWSLLFPDRWQQTYIWDRSLRCPMQIDYVPDNRRDDSGGRRIPIDYSVVPYTNYWIGLPFWTMPEDMEFDAEFDSLRVRPIRHADVKFPSRKVLATEHWVFCTNEPNKEFKLYTHGDTATLKGSTLACDGSVRRMARSQGLPGIWGEYSFMDTPGGVWGVDLP